MTQRTTRHLVLAIAVAVVTFALLYAFVHPPLPGGDPMVTMLWK